MKYFYAFSNTDGESEDMVTLEGKQDRCALIMRSIKACQRSAYHVRDCDVYVREYSLCTHNRISHRDNERLFPRKEATKVE